MSKEFRTAVIYLIIVGIAACILVAQLCPTPNPPGKWRCTVYEAPFEVVWLNDYRVTIYGGVATPTEEIKFYNAGNIEVGIDAVCTDNQNTFYRVRGSDLWWGWVRKQDIRE